MKDNTKHLQFWKGSKIQASTTSERLGRSTPWSGFFGIDFWSMCICFIQNRERTMLPQSPPNRRFVSTISSAHQPSLLSPFEFQFKSQVWSLSASAESITLIALAPLPLSWNRPLRVSRSLHTTDGEERTDNDDGGRKPLPLFVLPWIPWASERTTCQNFTTSRSGYFYLGGGARLNQLDVLSGVTGSDSWMGHWFSSSTFILLQITSLVQVSKILFQGAVF